jgi:hypothetical protein
MKKYLLIISLSVAMMLRITAADKEPPIPDNSTQDKPMLLKEASAKRVDLGRFPLWPRGF